MHKPHLFLVILFTLCIHHTEAQQKVFSCETVQPSVAPEINSLIQKHSASQHILTQSQMVPDTIHVIVHVLWSTPAMNIADSIIMKQLQILNEDFPRLNADAVNTPAPFAAIAGALPIRFALAQTDPLGQPTTGTNRVQTTHGAFGFATYFDMTHTANGGFNPWNSHYMNIYCAEMAPGAGGVGWMGSNICLINYQNFGQGRVGTHEMGHVFGLSHIWGPEQSTGGFVCSSDDGIADTPEQWEPIITNGPFPLYDTCTSTGNGIMYMNYMNYNFDLWENMFSQGQTALMINTLNTTSNDLINGATIGIDEVKSGTAVSIDPNPNNGRFKVSIPDDGTYEINILDLFGRCIDAVIQPVRGDTEMELDIVPGIYFMEVRSGNFRATKKFVVE